jgi:hypothetical protein
MQEVYRRVWRYEVCCRVLALVRQVGAGRMCASRRSIEASLPLILCILGGVVDRLVEKGYRYGIHTDATIMKAKELL